MPQNTFRNRRYKPEILNNFHEFITIQNKTILEFIKVTKLKIFISWIFSDIHHPKTHPPDLWSKTYM